MRNVTQGAGEQARLNALLTDVDPALLASLKADERRRRRKLLLFAITGGLVMGSAIAIALMLMLNGANPVGAKDADRSLVLSNEGWAAWQQQDLPRAAEKFKEAVAVDPRNANAWNGLGWARMNAGDPAEAQKAFERCAEIDKSHPAALNGLGVIAFNRRQFDRAEKYWQAAGKDAPAAQFGLARLYLLQGKWEQAERYAKGIADSPDDDGTAKRMLAAARAKAVAPELRKIIEPPPQTAGDVSRAWALFGQGKFNQARELFDAALKRNPNDANALNGLGFVHLNLGKPAEAKPYFEACLKADPDAPGPLNGLARCLKAEGKVDEAIRLWEKLAKLPPHPNAATAGLAWTHLEQKAYDKALPYFEELARATPADAEVQKGLQAAREHAATK